MKADKLYDAIGEIREDLIADAEAVPFRPRRRWLPNLAAACLTVCLLAIPVSAEVTTGYISNLLAPIYGMAQTELVDSVGVPIGASATVEGYTLTADAVIGDRYNIAIVYTLRREDGGILPEGICFDGGWGLMAQGRGSGGGSFSFARSEDGRTLTVTEEWTSSRRLFLWSRKADVTFRDLVYEAENGEWILLQEGSWNLKFTIRYKDTTVDLPVRDLEITSSGGKGYTIHRVRLSPFGLHMSLTVPNPDYDGSAAGSEQDFTVSLRLADGTVMEAEDWNMSRSGSLNEPTQQGTFGTSFPVPIPLEDIEALLICGTEVPVTRSYDFFIK